MFPDQLTEAAIDVEQRILGDVVGCQDQAFASYGGLNRFHFRKNGEIDREPLFLTLEDESTLESHLLLFFTNIPRTSSEVASTYAPSLLLKEREQFAMAKLTEEGMTAIFQKNYERLGKLIDQAWRIKSGMSSVVSNSKVDDLYCLARLCGAWGGKLTGAGGGGCMLLVAPPDKQEKIIGEMTKAACVHIPFRFSISGSQIVHAEHQRRAG